MKLLSNFEAMKQNLLNSSGSIPNYLNTSTTSREVSFNEITPTEGSLSEALKNFNVVFEDTFYVVDKTIYTDFLIPSKEDENQFK